MELHEVKVKVESILRRFEKNKLTIQEATAELVLMGGNEKSMLYYLSKFDEDWDNELTYYVDLISTKIPLQHSDWKSKFDWKQSTSLGPHTPIFFVQFPPVISGTTMMRIEHLVKTDQWNISVLGVNEAIIGKMADSISAKQHAEKMLSNIINAITQIKLS